MKETIIQLMKKEALVMETNQESAVVPPAKKHIISASKSLESNRRHSQVRILTG